MRERVKFAAAARTLLRDSIIGAVDDLARTRGWAATTMADVARVAGVSRQTLYNEFGSRPALVEAYVAREISVLVDEVVEAVRARADDPHLALTSAFELFLKLSSHEPVVQLIVANAGADEVGRLLTGLGRTLAADRIAELVPEIWPWVSAADARMLADTLVRLAISHALVPEEDPAVVAAGVGRMLSPFVDELLAARPASG